MRSGEKWGLARRFNDRQAIMIVIAHQFWDRSFRREIEIPDTTDLNTALNDAFKYGQNDVQVRETPSVSVGDILELPESFGDQRIHIVMSAGFESWSNVKLRCMFQTSKKEDTCSSSSLT